MCQTGHGRIELYDTAFGTMVALFTTAVMRMCGMCGSTMRAVVFQRSTTTCSCHHYSGNHTKQISQTAMSHYHLCCLVMHLFTLLLQCALAATASACITACTSAGATVTPLVADICPQSEGCTGNNQYGQYTLKHQDIYDLTIYNCLNNQLYQPSHQPSHDKRVNHRKRCPFPADLFAQGRYGSHAREVQQDEHEERICRAGGQCHG